MKLVLIGDGESPHLLKWARALHADARVGEGLYAASSRGFLTDFDACVPAQRRLALNLTVRHEGGNLHVLRSWPRLHGWLKSIQPDWLHAHYLSSHGTLAWLSRHAGGVDAQLASSAWGSDVLVTPRESILARTLLRKVLRDSAVTTSDSNHMAFAMRALGAEDPMVFPFGLESLPDALVPGEKDAHLCFTNRGLEPIYDPLRVADTFAHLHACDPDAQLVVAHEGSQRDAMERRLQDLGVAARVRFTGRLDARAQQIWYRKATWYLSLPRSDSVSVSLIEAMAHGCLPIVSDLPANREWVRDGDNGLVLKESPSGDGPLCDRMRALMGRGSILAEENRCWVAQHAMFEPCVRAFVDRLVHAMPAGRGR